MANRNTLAVGHIGDFEAWLALNGFKLQEPKGAFEVIRATRQGRKTPLVVYRKMCTANGKPIEHLTVADRDIGVIRAFLRDRRKR